jgi:hypothetical protein
MSNWECQYTKAAGGIFSPKTLDEKILQIARTYKMPRKKREIRRKAIGGFAAVGILVLLIHPAQYLGARTPSVTQTSQPQILVGEIPPTPNAWRWIRANVKAGDYTELCARWRQQRQGGANADNFPRDLAAEARRHCRAL